MEKIRTRCSPPPQNHPWTPCALRRRCATPADIIRRPRISRLASPGAGRLHPRRGRGSPRCPPRGAWRPARGRRCGWGVSQRPCTSSGTTCPRTTAKEASLWPRYKPSNTPLNTSTSFQTSWAARNGHEMDHFYAPGPSTSGHWMELVL